ncbi:MAG: hypothetical protein OQK09_12605 [Colwellia sp.]|nr:hypothetical protein [Colwellia sp.]MCW9082345.1 hypothetical protein [Colwellia sp.]
MINKFSYSQLLMAAAIAYLAYALINFTAQVPSFIRALDKTAPHIDNMINESNLVRTEIAQMRQLVDEQLPVILARIDTSLPLVKQGLIQSDNYAQQLPVLWSHLDNLEAQLTQIQQSIPSILERVDAMVLTANSTTDEVAKWRPHSSQYLAEIKQLRVEVPQYLSRIEYIVSDAKTLGKEASSGLVSGFFKGVISLPMEVVAGLTGIVKPDSKSAKLLTAADVTLLKEQTVTLLENADQKDIFWKNMQSGNKGQILKHAEFKKDGLSCHKITFINNLKGQKETLNELMCEDSEGFWQVM